MCDEKSREGNGEFDVRGGESLRGFQLLEGRVDSGPREKKPEMIYEKTITFGSFKKWYSNLRRRIRW